MSERKISILTTADFTRLNHACRIVTESLGHAPYLVGSSVNMEKNGVYRDVDVRAILDDEEFDHLFPKESVWSLFCLGVTTYLQAVSGLPVDFQVQRESEANEKYEGPRNPIGTGGRWFAGGGDATPYLGRQFPHDEALAEWAAEHALAAADAVDPARSGKGTDRSVMDQIKTPSGNLWTDRAMSESHVAALAERHLCAGYDCQTCVWVATYQALGGRLTSAIANLHVPQTYWIRHGHARKSRGTEGWDEIKDGCSECGPSEWPCATRRLLSDAEYPQEHLSEVEHLRALLETAEAERDRYRAALERIRDNGEGHQAVLLAAAALSEEES